jgi:hypothetical protein
LTRVASRAIVAIVTSKRRSFLGIVAAALIFGLADQAMAAVKCGFERATIVGTSGPDRIVGTPGRDVIVARDGRLDQRRPG